MGRAFRIIKRTAHLTVEVTERPQVIKAVAVDDAARPKRAQKSPAKTKTKTKTKAKNKAKNKAKAAV
jgi:hypothetical protein